MDIKLVLRKYSVYTLTIITAVIPALIVWTLFDRLLGGLSVIAAITAIIAATAVFNPLKDFYYRLANQYFFTSLYDSTRVMLDFDDKLKLSLDINLIYANLFETFSSALHPKGFCVYKYENAGPDAKITAVFSQGLTSVNSSTAETLSRLAPALPHREPLIVEETLIHQSNEGEINLSETNQQIHELAVCAKQNNIALISPLSAKARKIGIIAFGPKETGDMYNEEDLKLIRMITDSAAIAIDNALMYEEKATYNLRLQAEIEKTAGHIRESNLAIEARNEELTAANTALKELDAAKSEFISIASHQLRTPLTVTKGYISMMIDGDFGKITAKHRESLEKIYLSNERLIQLVENLLNVSRIDSKRMQYSLETKQIEDSADAIMPTIRDLAKRKGIKFTWEKPTGLPPVKFDDEKIRLVIFNLADNAVHYTKQGTITCALKEDNGEIEFSVADTGIGIAKEELPKLFDKFNRGQGTSTIHTEGVGLGLFVAKHIIKAHGGRVWAESKGVGTGARFVFRIPVLNE